jgi:hypothetical protein
MLKVGVDRIRRTITFRANGTLTLEEAKMALEEAKWATHQFGGGEHIVLADMRGILPMAPDVAAVFGEVIRYGRAHGTALCVHLSDSSIAKLQASRIARESSPGDDVTINVVSLDEAEKLVEESYKKLKR